MIRPWKKVRSTPIGDFRIFKLRSDVKALAAHRQGTRFLVFDSVDWVNVIAAHARTKSW